MAKIVVVTSGKGGVGKTTTSASFATGLALRGHKTVVIDFDVGLRNLDLNSFLAKSNRLCVLSQSMPLLFLVSLPVALIPHFLFAIF